jgi:hypothetical protein
VHAPCPLPRECCHKDTTALHGFHIDSTCAIRQRIEVEHIVFYRGHFSALGHNVPTSHNIAWICSRSLVEGLRGRCPPIGQQGYLIIIGKSDPAYVPVRGIVKI